MGEKKQILKGVLIVALIAFGFFAVSALYTEFGDDFKKISKEHSTYSAVIDKNGEVSYVKVNKEDNSTEPATVEDMATSYKEILSKHMSYENEEEYQRKLEYLINAETVTKMPYISSLEGDNTKLNGRIKFYRYTNEIEAAEGEEEVQEENEEKHIDPKKIFYIGDSWIIGLNKYVKDRKNEEYPGDNHFIAEESVGATANVFLNEKLKEKIDNVTSEVSTIVVMLGMYDTSENGSTRMVEIIDFLSETYSEKSIYVLKVPHVGKNYENEEITASDFNSNIDGYNTLISAHCSEKTNVKFIDATSDMMTGDLFLENKYLDEEDSLNNTGISVWYANIKECIEDGKSSASTTKYQLTYINNEEFEQKKEKFKASGDREVFKYFTIDDKQQIVIAFGETETRTITTDDVDITEDIVREVSGDSRYSGNAQGGFSFVEYRIFERPIDYLSCVEDYVLPTNLLFALLIETENIYFVEELAKLAYQTDIAIAIYDNESVSTTEENIDYEKFMRMNINTRMKYDMLKTTKPVITANSLNGSPFSNIPQRCYIQTDSKQHYLYHLPYEANPDISNFTNDTYITGSNNNREITGLGGATTFSTKFKKVITSNAISTYGVILADTWMARWKATYTQENVDPVHSAESGTYESAVTEQYSSMDELLSAFDANMSSNISKELIDHADKLRKNSIDQILTCSKEILEEAKYTIEDIKVAERKDLMMERINGCKKCKSYIQNWWAEKNAPKDPEPEPDPEPTPTPRPPKPPIGPYIPVLIQSNQSSSQNLGASASSMPHRDTIYHHIINGDLKSTHVSSDYWDALSKERDRRNDDLEIIFKNEVNEQVEYTQTASGSKVYQNIQFKSSYTKESTRYERNENIENDKIGEKFSKVFNDAKFCNTTGYLARNDWFWEQIRKSGDTEKLEGVLRLMFNIATDSDDFGNYDLDDPKLLENLFKAFEPKDMKEANKIYGNTVEAKLWYALIREGYSEIAVAGAMGNFQYESDGFKASRLEYEKLNETDESYTEKVNAGLGIGDGANGIITKEQFMRDGAGYGLIQWTFSSRKGNLWDYAQSKGVGIDDVNMQIEFLIKELTPDSGICELRSRNNFTADHWINAETVEDATEAFCWIFENPTKGDENLTTRKQHARANYEKFQGKTFAGNILETCEEITQLFLDREAHYSVNTNKLIRGDIERCYEEAQYICCATYVSLVLYRSGALTPEQINAYNYDWTKDGGMPDMLEAAGWQLLSPSEAQPGDVVNDYYGGHVLIYAGEGKCWDQNSCVYSSSGRAPLRRTVSYNLDGCQIWRQP